MVVVPRSDWSRAISARICAQLRVQVRERLVHEEGGRLADDGAAHRDSLALAAGEGARLALQELLEPEHARGLLDPLLDLLLGHLLQLQAERRCCRTRSECG